MSEKAGPNELSIKEFIQGGLEKGESEYKLKEKLLEELGRVLKEKAKAKAAPKPKLKQVSDKEVKLNCELNGKSWPVYTTIEGGKDKCPRCGISLVKDASPETMEEHPGCDWVWMHPLTFTGEQLLLSEANRKQPSPILGTRRVMDYVLKDIKERCELGKEKYGTYLKTNNGRDALIDAYQEVMDALLYLRQEILERQGK